MQRVRPFFMFAPAFVPGFVSSGVLGFGAALAALAPPCTGQTASPGWSASDVTIAPAGAFVGGFEVLPNGHWAVFDGDAVVELLPDDGSFVRTIFTPFVPVFGAFLTLSPDGTKIYFGESTLGNIFEIVLATGSFTLVADTSFPYDMAFDPQGRPFVQYAFGFGNGSHVALVDFNDGSFDDVVDSPDASGPIVFDAAGNLYTATPDTSSFPPPPDTTEILRFDAAEINGAIGPSVLTVADGELLGLVDGVTGIALDEADDIFVTDPNTGVLTEIDGVTRAETIAATAGDFVAFLYLRFVRGKRGACEPWQPETGGELLAVRSDFFSFNAATRVRPHRPELFTTPASPVPPGPFDLQLTGAVPNGFGYMLLALQGTAAEVELHNRSWPAPLFVGLDLSGGLVVVPVLTDNLGEAHFSASNPGLSGLQLGLQCVVGASATGPFYGTSNPFELVLN